MPQFCFVSNEALLSVVSVSSDLFGQRNKISFNIKIIWSMFYRKIFTLLDDRGPSDFGDWIVLVSEKISASTPSFSKPNGLVWVWRALLALSSMDGGSWRLFAPPPLLFQFWMESSCQWSIIVSHTAPGADSGDTDAFCSTLLQDCCYSCIFQLI